MRKAGCLARLARSSLETATSGTPGDAQAAFQRALPSAWLATPWGQPHLIPEGRRGNATHAASSCPADAAATAASTASDAALTSTAALAEATSSHLPASFDDLPIVAHASLEDSLALFLSPTQLGAQLWEGAHAASGLPWWAAIPAASLALRGALLPLSLRAYAASANITLLHRAVGASRGVAEAVAEAAEAQRRRRREEEQQQVAGSEAAAEAAGKGEARKGKADEEEGGVALGRVELVRRIATHLRAHHRVPSFGWYLGNAALQVPLAVSLTLALRRMCDSLWPGLTGEGLLYFTDLTVPPVYLQTLSTPYGTAGAILPLALALLYVSTVDRSAGASSPGIHTALKLLTLPLYCAALLQPHAVLLYWSTAVAGQLGTYAAVERLPALRRAAGVPEGLLQPPQPGQGASKSADEVPLDDLLLALADSYGKAGNAAASRACLKALIARQPEHAAATERLAALTAPAERTA